LDLAAFPKPEIVGNRSRYWILIWAVIGVVFFRSPLPLLPYGVKATLLRGFGARIGKNFVIKPSVCIKYPWFLSVGDNAWVGEGVWLDNPGMITIGSNVCISQGAYLVTGNHNFRSSGFEYFAQPIDIGDRCWICAKAIVPPGSCVPAGAVLGIGEVWRNDLLV
jgi:putative colanic acid biosynthesis acetyltransferase WcaF